MKLYYAPGACSLADHIALNKAGLTFEHEKVDLKTKKTAGGEDFTQINPKGYVPALTLHTGETLSENIAILDWIAHQGGALSPSGAMGHTHLLEALAYISTEIHKSFKPFFAGASDEEAIGTIVISVTLSRTYHEHLSHAAIFVVPRLSGRRPGAISAAWSHRKSPENAMWPQPTGDVCASRSSGTSSPLARRWATASAI
jgi:glutathione S-transferase